MWKRDESVRTPPRDQHDRSAEPTPAGGRPSATVVLNLGKSVIIKGELSASEDLALSGQMEGSISLSGHTLTIGPDADIKAAISAKVVVVMGAVTGNVTAGERVEIQATGTVTGDVVSPHLVVAEGGYLRGRVEMAGARPARQQRAVAGAATAG